MVLRRLLTFLLPFGCMLACAPGLAQATTSGIATLIFVGDIMVAHDEETCKLIERGIDPFTPFAKILKQADLAIGNLECVVAGKGEPVKKPYRFLAHPRCLPVLKQHFTAFTVANNHSGDFGKAAFLEQCELLEKADIPYFGGGRKADAHKPWIVDQHGLRIAMLGTVNLFAVVSGRKQRAWGGRNRTTTKFSPIFTWPAKNTRLTL